MAIRIVVSNRATVPLPWTMPVLRAALVAQMHDLRRSEWGLDVTVLATHSGRVDGELVLVDDSDQAGALGYHETVNGVPGGIVAVKTTMAAGYSPSVTASHELLEMAGDLDANALCEVETSGGFRGVAYELADPVEADRDGYMSAGVLVSNFVLPAWFLPGSAGPWDWLRLLKAPLTLRPGGYMAAFDPSHGWTQKFARDEVTGHPSFRALCTQRIPRRAERGAWKRQLAAAAHGVIAEPLRLVEVRAGEQVV